MPKLRDVTPGTVFGQLTVLGCCISDYKNHALCLCTCGTVKKVLLYSLGRSNNHNCGCLRKGDRLHRLPTDERKEATKLARTYRLWDLMWEKFGMANKLSDLPLIPESWKDFNTFKQDMGFCPIGMVLDRIDARLPYSAENCRWAPQRDALANKESTVYYYNGKTVVHEQYLSQLLGYAAGTLKSRRLRGELPLGWKVIPYDKVVAIRKATLENA